MRKIHKYNQIVTRCSCAKIAHESSASLLFSFPRHSRLQPFSGRSCADDIERFNADFCRGIREPRLSAIASSLSGGPWKRFRTFCLAPPIEIRALLGVLMLGLVLPGIPLTTDGADYPIEPGTVARSDEGTRRAISQRKLDLKRTQSKHQRDSPKNGRLQIGIDGRLRRNTQLTLR